jgi:soluble lytic murein transglycosylase-like protein
MKRAFATFAAGLAMMISAGSAHADCFDEAAKYQKVNPLILRAIAWQESHNRPDAQHKNANGSIDYGVMQINSIHLPVLAQYGISQGTLMEPCKNVYIAAWHLRHQMNKYGNTWQAVGAYHSETPALRDKYSQQIAAILRKWNLLPAGR